MIARSMKTALDHLLPWESPTIRRHNKIRAIHLEFGIPNQVGGR